MTGKRHVLLCPRRHKPSTVESSASRMHFRRGRTCAHDSKLRRLKVFEVSPALREMFRELSTSEFRKDMPITALR